MAVDADLALASGIVEEDLNRQLTRKISQLESENEVLHRKVNDLGHKFCRARRERDRLVDKLNKSEREAHFYRGLVFEKLAKLIDEEL